jgi:hypothetical protein
MTVADLKKYKDSCYSALSRDLTEFEKNFLLIAGGILAFSTTFIKDIVKLSSLVWLPLLFCAWAFIIVSIGLMMSAFLKSASASDKLLNTLAEFEEAHTLHRDAEELTDEQFIDIKGKLSTILKDSKSELKAFRNWAVRLFLVGILFFAGFIAINLLHEQRNAEKGENKIEITKGKQTVTITEN